MGPLSAHHTDCPIPTMGDRSVQTPPPSSHLGAMNVGTGWEVCTERCMLPSAQRARHGDRASLSPSDIAERRGVSPSEGPQTLTDTGVSHPLDRVTLGLVQQHLSL